MTGGPDLLAVAHEYLDPLRRRDIDTLILGCTHYPLLTGVISYVLGDQVTLVSAPRRPPRTSTGCWSQTASSATRRCPPVHRFLTTGQPGEFEAIGRRFLGPELERLTSSRRPPPG